MTRGRTVVVITLLLGCTVAGTVHLAQTHRAVTRVVDGDTLVVSTVGKVRLIGIDTPETVHPSKPVEWMGREASDATKRFALGKSVRLETDVQKRDRYGRLLAYVWLPDGSMLNEVLVKEGYANVSTYPPNVKYESRFLSAQRSARTHAKGLWAPHRTRPTDEHPATPARTGNEIVHITASGTRYHVAGCRYLSKSDIAITRAEAIRRGLQPCKSCGAE